MSIIYLDGVTLAQFSETLEEDVHKILEVIDSSKWKGQPLKFEKSDGYVNKNIIIHPEGKPEQRILIRLFNSKISYYLRFNKRNYKFYNDHGLSARIWCMFGNGCVMDVVPGTPITLATTGRLYEPDVQRAVAEAAASFHTDRLLTAARQAGFQESWIGWHEPEWFLPLFGGLPETTTDSSGNQLTLPTAQQVLEELAVVTRALDERGSPLAFCHGDMNPSNLIYNDETKKAAFIDYDSPCITHAMFDVAVHLITIHDVFNAYRQMPSEDYVRKWLFHYLTKKNEFNGIHTFAPVSDGEIDRYVDDLKVAHLKATLHMMSCFASFLCALGNSDQPFDRDWVIGLVRDHWIYYQEKKKTVLNT